MLGFISFFWDIWQQGQIDQQATKTKTLEERVGQLEHALTAHQELLRRTILVLEYHLGKDIDLDGMISRLEPVPPLPPHLQEFKPRK